MLTNEDIQKLVEVFATKKEVVTKEDLKLFATKEDLNKLGNNLLTEIFSTKKDLEDFKEETRKNFSDLLSAIDAYAKKADAYFQEMVMLSH